LFYSITDLLGLLTIRIIVLQKHSFIILIVYLIDKLKDIKELETIRKNCRWIYQTKIFCGKSRSLNFISLTFNPVTLS